MVRHLLRLVLVNSDLKESNKIRGSLRKLRKNVLLIFIHIMNSFLNQIHIREPGIVLNTNQYTDPYYFLPILPTNNKSTILHSEINKT